MKGNIMMRLIALMILIPAALAQVSGQIDLTQPSWIWLTLFAGVNALQSTFTGWCPATKFFGKDENTGQCCATDTIGSCCKPTDATQNQAKPPKQTACCSSLDSEEIQTKNPCTIASCLDIKVLGSGCDNCTQTQTLLKETAHTLNIACCITKVSDLAEIAHYGVMATPGIVINGKTVHSGSIPSKQQVTLWLAEAQL